MSSFMSSKYRRLAGLDAAARPIIEREDERCAGCGYVLTGLRRGARCPECGMDIPLTVSGAHRPDPLLALDPAGRRGVGLAAGFAAVGLLIVALEPIVFLVLSIITQVSSGFVPDALYLALRASRLVVAGLWAVAAVMALRPSFLALPEAPGTRFRWPVLVGLMGFAVVQLMLVTGIGADVAWITGGLRLVGGACAGVAMYTIARAAEEADLEVAGERLKAGAMILPILGLIRWLLPESFAWFMVFVFLMFVVLPWTWFAFQAARGMLAVRYHVVWARRLSEQAAGRDDRVAARRAELDAEVRRTVRPLPGEGA